MLFLNSGIQGASALFNGVMREQLKTPLRAYAMHDHVLLLLALTMGEIVYLDEALMYYRQHESNVTGHQPGSRWKKVQLMWVNRHVPVVSREHYEGTKAFYECYRFQLREDDRQVIETYLRLPDYPWFKRFYVIYHTRFSLLGSRPILWIKLGIRRYI